MKTRLSKRSVVLAAGALALLCVLFILGRPMPAAEHDSYRTRLRQLRVQSAELEQDLLRSHVGMPRVHGSPREALAALRTRAEELRAFPSFLTEPERRTLGAVLDNYLRALADEEALMVRLQTQEAGEAEATLRLLLDSPASPEAERLITTYLQLYEGALARAERFRITLFAVSLLLVAFVLVVLVRLSRTGAALDTLNAELEARVEERTAALSAANTELRESEARKAALLESSLDGIISLDETGRILEFSPAAESIFRLSRAQALGRDFLSLALAATVMPEQRATVARSLRADAAPGRATRLELQGLRADGNSFPAELTFLRVRSDGPARFTTYVRDITERREVERLKNEFVSTVSHELRTPLTSIRGSLGLLEGGVLGELPPQAQDMVRIARTNTERLIRLINDILDLEKMESGKLELKLQSVETAEVIEATFSGVQGMADSAKVRLNAEAGGAGPVRADRDRLIQVLTNLVSNAIKFSPPDCQVEVRAARDARGQVRFSVVDQGPGIPLDQRDRLFGKFQQLDSSDTRTKGGTGLGLAISQAIVEQHGGRIEVHSEPGQGATFTFSLTALRVGSGPSSVVTDESRYTILAVTTDSELSGLLRGLLTHEGYRVLRSPSLEEAEKLIEVGAPDMLVLDAQNMDGGLEFVRKLREEPRTRELPVLLLSGHSPQEEGVVQPLLVDWMEKPFDETRFLLALRHAIRRPGQARVLIVDDDVSTRRVLRTQLERLGVACYEAEDGEGAVALARTTPPDLIVLDVGLPRLDGFEVVDILRQGKGRGTPLIVFTGRELSSMDQNQLTLGITRHLTKARTSEDELLASVKELLKGLLARRNAGEEPRKEAS
ncbi:ATP-binding protein [Archangium lansingense]|uniref:histidine kinase n=1 Tax=Archangium lansingense TaxID=2995310 RepID=A0ABT4A1X9_9BACT|nr:ATP-binding protein [Archangium lansinium]MCY1075596.1 ATP-binding protein [Archangium lansinium]